MKNRKLLAVGLIVAVIAVSVGVVYLVSGQDLLASTFFRNDIYATNITANSMMKSGNAEVNSNINVKGRGDIRGDLNVQGSAWINNNLTVNGQTTLNSNVLVNGEVNVSQTISAQALKLGGQILNLSNLVTTQNVQNVVSNILASMNLAQYIDLSNYVTISAMNNAISDAINSIPTPSTFNGTITFNGDIVANNNQYGTTQTYAPIQIDPTNSTARCLNGQFMTGVNYTTDVGGNIQKIVSVSCAEL
jgi:cytoskeletal protein CcmA (bactofilin family)